MRLCSMMGLMLRSVARISANGDELCCLAPLSRANFTPAAYRVIGPEPVPATAGAFG